ncbi:MAG: hypothetical protein ICV79_27835 [Flavisolibacter sp.]|nr:hypothetical protein [Flavisolibacter sp.]
MENTLLKEPHLLLQMLVVSFAILFFTSCKKEHTPETTNGPTPVPDTVKNALSGQEFIFNDLTWKLYDSGFGPTWDEIYLGTPARADLFVNAPGLNYNPKINAEVSVKFDTANYWEQVPPMNGAAFNSFIYFVNSPYLYVETALPNYSLIGKKASIKVKFL